MTASTVMSTSTVNTEINSEFFDLNSETKDLISFFLLAIMGFVSSYSIEAGGIYAILMQLIIASMGVLAGLDHFLSSNLKVAPFAKGLVLLAVAMVCAMPAGTELSELLIAL